MSAINKNERRIPNVWSQVFPESVTQPLRLAAARRFRTFQLPETKEEWDKLRPELYRKTAEAIRLKVDE